VGRTCYKSENKITAESAPKFIRMLYERGHHAMLEHCVASVKFVCDRGVTHELVRHRLVAYAQESTRYCDYNKEKFDGQIAVIEPPGLDIEQRRLWIDACEQAEKSYMKMRELGVAPQIARAVLPTCLKTEIWATANLREWAHICTLRCAPAAHPQMRELMCRVKKVFAEKIPEMFSKLSEHVED
jgi:thymidylate synthase (FAD)